MGCPKGNLRLPEHAVQARDFFVGRSVKNGEYLAYNCVRISKDLLGGWWLNHQGKEVAAWVTAL